jgi:hypothetical protein
VRRLVAADNAGIAFRWKDYHINGPGLWRTMRLHPHEFNRRFLLHVLPKRFHRIRHYGLFANGRASQRPAHYSMSPCRRPATGYRAGRATCAALPVPTLWRSDDCDRGDRARLCITYSPGVQAS